MDISQYVETTNDYLCHAANTVFGWYHLPFSEEWDEMLDDMISRWSMIEVTDLTIKFIDYKGKTYEVWVGNRWYAYGNLYTINGRHIKWRQAFRPRFRTMRRLHNLHMRMLELKRSKEISYSTCNQAV